MLNRREFMKQVGIALAGGVAAVSGIAAIVPTKPEVAHPLSEAWLEARHAMMDSMIEGIKLGEATFDTAQDIDDLTIALHNYAIATDSRLTDSQRKVAFLPASLKIHSIQFQSTHSGNYWGDLNAQS